MTKQNESAFSVDDKFKFKELSETYAIINALRTYINKVFLPRFIIKFINILLLFRVEFNVPTNKRKTDEGINNA